MRSISESRPRRAAGWPETYAFASSLSHLGAGRGRLWAAFGALAAVGLLACGDDAVEPDPSEGALTAEEAEALYLGIQELLNLEADPPHFTVIESVGDTMITARCNGGGTVVATLSAEESQRGDTARLSIRAKMTHDGCQLPEVNGHAYMVSGEPDISITTTLIAVVTEQDFAMDVEGFATGAVRWSLGERMGECRVNMVLLLDGIDGMEPIASMNGLMCGHELKVPIEIITEGT